MAVMKRLWSTTELRDSWSVRALEHQQIQSMDGVGRLGFVAQLTFYRLYARFPDHRNEFAAAVLTYLTKQIGTDVHSSESACCDRSRCGFIPAGAMPEPVHDL
jgi:hypothetical protein